MGAPAHHFFRKYVLGQTVSLESPGQGQTLCLFAGDGRICVQSFRSTDFYGCPTAN